MTNPNDPDDENEHFKQPVIAIELLGSSSENKNLAVTPENEIRRYDGMFRK